MIEDGGSFTPQEVAQAFYKDIKTPGCRRTAGINT